MNLRDSVSIVVVNYNAPDLIERFYDSVRKFYPDIYIHIVDGTTDNELKSERCFDSNTYLDYVNYNIHHGPGLDRGINLVDTPYVLTCDNDIIFQKPNLIENMLALMTSDTYAMGRPLLMNEEGFTLRVDEKVTPSYCYNYIIPCCMLLNRELYFKLPPAVKHGNPMCKPFVYMRKRNLPYKVVEFPTFDYVEHEQSMTRKRGHAIQICWVW